MNGFAEGEVGFEWQTRGNFLIFPAHRDIYGFPFSVRRVFIDA
jgi:hypothetical protein